MGKLSLRETLWAYVEETGVICFFSGHLFEYEPMEGDVPPFLFDNCARCSLALADWARFKKGDE